MIVRSFCQQLLAIRSVDVSVVVDPLFGVIVRDVVQEQYSPGSCRLPGSLRFAIGAEHVSPLAPCDDVLDSVLQPVMHGSLLLPAAAGD
jgi:hypothetical protein